MDGPNAMIQTNFNAIDDALRIAPSHAHGRRHRRGPHGPAKAGDKLSKLLQLDGVELTVTIRGVHAIDWNSRGISGGPCRTSNSALRSKMREGSRSNAAACCGSIAAAVLKEARISKEAVASVQRVQCRFTDDLKANVISEEEHSS